MDWKIKTIDHSYQRYETVGDYWKSNPQLINVRVSDFSGAAASANGLRVDSTDISRAERYEFLVTIHELIEAFLCYQAGVDFGDIDLFDMNFKGEGEPGDSLECPYFKQHKIATELEKQLAAHMGVDWDEYENAVNKLSTQAEQEKEA